MPSIKPTIIVNGAWAVFDAGGLKGKVLEDSLSFLHPDRFYNRAYKEQRWDGKVRFFKGPRFPSGLVQRVVDHVLEAYSVDVKVITPKDRNPVDLSGMTRDYLPGIELWDHQWDAVQSILKNSRGVIKSPTGCHPAGQKVLMSNGSERKVEHVNVGDALMGPDFRPRKVIGLYDGISDTYKISSGGFSFQATLEHVLTFGVAWSLPGEEIQPTQDHVKDFLCDMLMEKWFKLPTDARTSTPVIRSVQLGSDGFCRLQVMDPPKIDWIGFCKFYGFELEGDGRYLLDNFIVTHNSGKTEIMAAAAQYFWEQKGWRTLIVVPKRGLLTQTVARLKKYFKGTPEVGQCGDKVKDVKDVTVATAATLLQHKARRKNKELLPANPELADLVRRSNVLLLDECHHASSESWYEIAMDCGAIKRFGLSGTPLKNDDLADIRLTAATGPIIYEVASSKLITSGLAAKPKIAMIMSRNASGPELPKSFQEDGKSASLPYSDAYDDGIIDNQYHNSTVIRSIAWLVDNGRQTLVLCRRKRHFEKIAGMMESAGIDFRACWGATDTYDRNEAKNLLQEKKIQVLIGTVIFDEGEDVPGINALVLAEGVKVNTNALQRIGRGMRRKREGDVWVVDIVPVCHRKLAEHAVKRAKAYEEEGFEVVVVDKWPKMGEMEDGDLLPFKNWSDALSGQG